MGEIFLRLGIRIKQLATEGAVSPNPDQPLVEGFKEDLTIRKWDLVDV